MRILGLDLSITSPGFCVMDVNDDFTVSKIALYGFTKTQKWPYDGENLKIFQLPKDYDKHPSHYRPKIVYEIIKPYLDNVDYIAIEDYAFAGKGKVFDLAEFAGGMKEIFYNLKIPMKKFPPMTVKLCATKNHMADKIMMGLFFKKTRFANMIDQHIFELPEYESPQEDLIDSLYMANVLRAELSFKENAMFPNDLDMDETACMKSIVLGSATAKTKPSIEHPLITFGDFSRVQKKKIPKKVKKEKVPKEPKKPKEPKTKLVVEKKSKTSKKKS